MYCPPQNFIEQLGLPAEAIARGMGDTLGHINFATMRCVSTQAVGVQAQCSWCACGLQLVLTTGADYNCEQ
jgi:hypothetical protein